MGIQADILCLVYLLERMIYRTYASDIRGATAHRYFLHHILDMNAISENLLRTCTSPH